MSKPTKDYTDGHNRGYKEGKKEQNQSEVANWIDALQSLISPSERPRSKDYEEGRKKGYKDSYRN